MSDEDWVKSAITDDSVVVDLLMRLRQAHPPKISKTNLSPNFPLHWSVRQRRSRSAPKSTPTSSPTTPLSWSGGATSVSGGEESSKAPSNRPPHAARSKVNATYGTSTNKRTKKRKNLVELKEEETLLLNERKNLKREIAAVRIKLSEQKAANEKLKRLKVDSESACAAETLAPLKSFEAIPEEMQRESVTCNLVPPVTQPDIRTDVHEVSSSISPNVSPKLLQQRDVNIEEDKFMLPDLNLPTEDSNSTVLGQIS